MLNEKPNFAIDITNNLHKGKSRGTIFLDFRLLSYPAQSANLGNSPHRIASVARSFAQRDSNAGSSRSSTRAKSTASIGIAEGSAGPIAPGVVLHYFICTKVILRME